jgi:malonyl-CoA/methylmalonyl-CoA synthetase
MFPWLTVRQKGVLLSTPVITAQAKSLVEAWKYTSADLLLHLLPLHHIHGIINALFTPLLAGSAIEFLFPFNANAIWQRLADPFLPTSASSSRPPITFLTAVPTIYNRLLSTHPSLDQKVQDAARKAIAPTNLRLNISGSAALPTPTQSAWTSLSDGNILLERYGMTEVGMALSCGLNTADRVDGSVGWPLPSVEVRLVEAETNQVITQGGELCPDGKEREGEIQLRGPTIFSEYWRNPKATEDEFVEDDDGKGKWFKTGDVAVRRSVDGAGESSQSWANGPMYFIRGRKSVDIIKSGGEKVSALEVERELLSLPQVSEAAVVGVPSVQWGQKIAAIIVLDPLHANSGKKGERWGAMDMRRALRDKLANYKIPHELKIVQSIPRNAMGKSRSPRRPWIPANFATVNKRILVKDMFGHDSPG